MTTSVAPEPSRRTCRCGGLFPGTPGATAVWTVPCCSSTSPGSRRCRRRSPTRGRVGSEEVRDVINATFTSILELAHDQRGSLLKFGGDAVLLLLEGGGAALRAAVAARQMLDRLRARNPVATSGGEVTLGATVGVHVGPIDLFQLRGARSVGRGAVRACARARGAAPRAR